MGGVGLPFPTGEDGWPCNRSAPGESHRSPGTRYSGFGRLDFYRGCIFPVRSASSFTIP